MFHYIDVTENRTSRHLGRLGPFVADEVVDVAMRIVLSSIPAAEDCRVLRIEPDGRIAREAPPEARLLAWKTHGHRAVIVTCPGVPSIAFDAEAVAREAVGLPLNSHSPTA